VFAGIAARSARAEVRASLRVVRFDPFIVRGRGFRSRERVTITAYLPRARRTVHLTASAAGSFTVRLGRLRSYDPCASSFAVQARGSLGSNAVYKALPRACAVRQP
jgi:hypothetical protein